MIESWRMDKIWETWHHSYIHAYRRYHKSTMAPCGVKMAVQIPSQENSIGTLWDDQVALRVKSIHVPKGLNVSWGMPGMLYWRMPTLKGDRKQAPPPSAVYSGIITGDHHLEGGWEIPVQSELEKGISFLYPRQDSQADVYVYLHGHQEWPCHCELSPRHTSLQSCTVIQGWLCTRKYRKKYLVIKATALWSTSLCNLWECKSQGALVIDLSWLPPPPGTPRMSPVVNAQRRGRSSIFNISRCYICNPPRNLMKSAGTERNQGAARLGDFPRDVRLCGQTSTGTQACPRRRGLQPLHPGLLPWL